MSTAIVTGSGGLIGSESVKYFVEAGYDVIGIENDMRARFFGPGASTRRVSEELVERYPEFRWLDLDIRDSDAVSRVFATATELELIIHAAGQPSHDWAASDPPHRLNRQRKRHPQPVGGHSPLQAGGDVHLHFDEQGVRRPPKPSTARRAR